MHTIIICYILDAKTLTAPLSYNIIRGQPHFFFSNLASRQPPFCSSQTTVSTLLQTKYPLPPRGVVGGEAGRGIKVGVGGGIA